MFVNQIEGYCRWPDQLILQLSLPRSFLPSADWRGRSLRGQDAVMYGALPSHRLAAGPLTISRGE